MASKNTKQNGVNYEAAQMVFRSMAADMRRQGWQLTDREVEEMVNKLLAQLMAVNG
jgi:hypothetical protein